MPFEKFKKVLKTALGAALEKAAEHPLASQAGASSAGKTPPPTRKERAPRVAVRPEHDISLELMDLSTLGRTTRCPLSNISVSGVAFLIPDAEFSAPTGTRLRGRVWLGGAVSPVELEVIHITRGVVGARWTSMKVSFKKSLWEYLAPERAAAESLRMKDEFLKPEPDGKPIYYQGQAGNEYFLVHRDGQVIRQHITLFGIRVDCKTGEKPGFMGPDKEIGDSSSLTWPEDYIVLKLSAADQEKILAQSSRYVRALPGLESSIAESASEALMGALKP